MNLRIPWLLAAAIGWPGVVGAQLQLAPGPDTQCLFAGTGRVVTVIWRNPGDDEVEREIRVRLIQTTSSTAVPLAETSWKTLRVLPRQTVIESVPLDFPAVRARTKFLIEWLENATHVLGRIEVTVYPTNLLEGLKPLAGGGPVGVFDPQNEIKPLLAAAALEIQDLEVSGIKNCTGRLAIIGPLSGRSGPAGNLHDAVAGLARPGVAVVWIKADAPARPELEPAVFTVPLGLGTVTVVRPRALAGLAENPLAQLNLVRAAQLAAQPGLLSLNICEPSTH